MNDPQKIMTEIVPQKLAEIEKSENVRILHCVESGSRAWGFASPDSDFDVRFIYVREQSDYLRLDEMRDVIEWQLDETLDINGWDLKKALCLLQRSNPTLFEWIRSPIVYKTTPEWERISSVSLQYFRQKPGLYHYLSMAKKNYREFLTGETVKQKKYFYVLRPILACRWILKHNCPPPMLFTTLADACLPAEVRPAVDRLLQLKMASSELGQGERIDVINRYLDASIAEIESILAEFPKDEPYSWAELNRIFLDILQ